VVDATSFGNGASVPALRSKWRPSSASREFANWGPKIVIEKAANGAAVIETIRKTVPGVIAMTPIGSKAQRLSAVVPIIESGSCYLPEGANFTADFVEEFATFPGRHDDMLDCGVWALQALNEGGGLSHVGADFASNMAGALGFDPMWLHHVGGFNLKY